MNEINKILFLSKIKFGIENSLTASSKAEINARKKQEFFEKKVRKWDDFK